MSAMMLVGILFCLFAGVMICKAMGYLITVKKKRWAWIVLYVGCVVPVSTVIFVGDTDNLPLSLAVFLALVWISCEGSALKRLTIGLMVGSTVFAYNGIIDNFLWPISEAYFWIGRGVFAAGLLLVTRILAPDDGYELSDEMWSLLLILTISPVGIVFSVVCLSEWNYKVFKTSKGMYLLLLILTLCSFVGLILTAAMLAKQKKLEQQNMFGRINQKYYEAMEQQHFEIRRLKHDLANHLQTLAVLPEEKKDVYIQELLHHSLVTQTLNYCGDGTVNAVLTVKENLISANGIVFRKKVEIPEELPFGKSDICAIFANALDNAVEACMKELPQKREICLESRAGKGLFVLSVKNPCSRGFLQTTKADRQNHGIGLQSMREIVKRYHGDVEIRREEEQFELFLYLPMEREEWSG